MENNVVFQYQSGIVAGGYAFSARNNVITLSKYVETLDNERIREAIKYEAERARFLYVQEINRLKLAGEKVRTFHTKCEASKKAKLEAQAKYTDIWNDVENTCNAHVASKAPYQPYMASSDQLDPAPSPHQNEKARPLTIIHQQTQYTGENINPQQLIAALIETLDRKMNSVSDRCTLKDALDIIGDISSEREVQLCILYL